MTSHTTSAASDSAETHIVRAVNTGIIDVGSRLVRFLEPLANVVTGRSSCSRVRIKIEAVGAGTGSREGETEGRGQGKRAYVMRVPFCTTLGLVADERPVKRNRTRRCIGTKIGHFCEHGENRRHKNRERIKLRLEKYI